MQQINNKLDTIVLFDGIAIFFIVIYHELVYYQNTPLFSLEPYLVYLGLSLFTFSSGFKLMINHSNELGQKIFLSKYYMKRFIRLYKAYVGYTLLTLIPLLIVIYFAIYIFHLDFPGITTILTKINNTNIFSFLKFLCGDNPITSQLWYLIGLIVITSICFTILYFLDIKWLFFSFIPFFLISLLIQSGMLIQLGIIFYFPFLISNVFLYLPFFIFGSFWGYNQQYQMGKWFQIAQFLVPIFFFIFIVSATILQNFINKSILIYFSCFLFPFFLLSIFDHVKKIKFLYSSLMFCGIYSFQIYLFHMPLILPIISRIIINILKIDYIFMPILITILVIFVCVIVYKIVKTIHLNILFE